MKETTCPYCGQPWRPDKEQTADREPEELETGALASPGRRRKKGKLARAHISPREY